MPTDASAVNTDAGITESVIAAESAALSARLPKDFRFVSIVDSSLEINLYRVILSVVLHFGGQIGRF